jgi:hypothetical protein
MEKIYSKKNKIFLIKNCNLPSLCLKNVQATEEAFSPQKRTSSTSKYEISLKFFFSFMGHFCPLRSESGSGFRIGYGSTDLIESGSDPDPKHCPR